MNISYDPKLINQAVKSLYKEASIVIIRVTLLYGLISLILGAVIGVSFNSLLPEPNFSIPLILSIISTPLGAFYGYKVGTGKSILLKLQAQNSLCLVEIEKKLSK